MTSLDKAYDEIAHVLNLPAYFGRNLDALEECLNEIVDREGGIEVVITHHKALGSLEDWERIEEVFKDNEKVTLSFTEASL